MIGLIVMITGVWIGWKIIPEVWKMKDGAERGISLAAVIFAIVGGMVLLHRIVTGVIEVIDDFSFHFELFSLETFFTAVMIGMIVLFIQELFFSKNAKFV